MHSQVITLILHWNYYTKHPSWSLHSGIIIDILCFLCVLAPNKMVKQFFFPQWMSGTFSGESNVFTAHRKDGQSYKKNKTHIFRNERLNCPTYVEPGWIRYGGVWRQQEASDTYEWSNTVEVNDRISFNPQPSQFCFFLRLSGCQRGVQKGPELLLRSPRFPFKQGNPPWQGYNILKLKQTRVNMHTYVCMHAGGGEG